MQWNLLDCTLRDGGYYTNWDFSNSLVQNYIRTMADLPIDYIEIGYRNPTQSGYQGEYYYLPNSSLMSLYQIVKGGPKLAIMLDAKNCNPGDVPNLLNDCRDIVKLVRMAVNPAKIEDGIALAKAVKQCGFEVALNLMYLSKAGDDYSFLSRFEDLENVVDYLYLVDSYGACYPKQVREAVKFAVDNLPQKIGFHGHDNISLAFANVLAAIEAGVDIIDATVLGMGRGAGNLRTELIIAYLAQVFDKPIDLSSLADLLETFQTMKNHYGWGSELPYIVSGLADLPQKDVMEWLGKKRYSTSTVVQALQGKQQNIFPNQTYPKLSDSATNLDLQNFKTCVIVGGGSTAVEHSNAISEFVSKQQGLLIHSSLKNAEVYAKAKIPQILCLPGREAEKLKRLSAEDLHNQFKGYVLSSSPRMTSVVPRELSEKTFEVEPITQIRDNSQIALMQQDSPLGIGLSIAQALNIESAYLCGFDGYPGGNEVEQELAMEVQDILEYFTTSNINIRVRSLTPTRYDLQQHSVYALLRN